jgi:hypothetical protein
MCALLWTLRLVWNLLELAWVVEALPVNAQSVLGLLESCSLAVAIRSNRLPF